MKLRKAIIAYWVINLALGGAHAWSQLDVQSSDSTNLTGSLAATFYGELIGGTQETSTGVFIEFTTISNSNLRRLHE